MQPWKKRQNHDCIFIMWKDKLHSCQFVTEEVGQNIQPESSKATHLGHHPDQQVQLLFYPVNTAVTWKGTVRTFFF